MPKMGPILRLKCKGTLNMAQDWNQIVVEALRFLLNNVARNLAEFFNQHDKKILLINKKEQGRNNVTLSFPICNLFTRHWVNYGAKA